MPENSQAVRDNAVARRAGGSSAVDAAAGQILNLIRARQLNVGDVLPTERELSEIARATVNERVISANVPGATGSCASSIASE